MHEQQTLEQRVAALEQEVADLKKQLRAPESDNGDWVERMSGSMKDYPEFDEVIRLGAEWRRSQLPPDEPNAKS